ncbi:GNAT family N-acetyltransferase [Chryseobacterium bernardetii]|uniref:GNAT family N-acetyltransferase n=1 Tax=Chryseobacterium bernardetii TaxID=1241978 RepID=A0A3G6T5H2_9FLAO|nr:GNAT family N-acetyltransferase [Chryseobacterium bernardetii]AZB24428.1 GNAT family N-acetyltransferase [Chryseobacterium bernardetii]
MYNVLIRPLVKEDALTSYQWRNDSEIWKFTGSRPNITVTQEVESEWIEKVLKDDSSKRFAILCDGEYIGNVQLTNINNDSAEFHIFIGKKEFWGKGISQLATYQILYYAKEVLKLSEVYLFVRPENIAAIKSYQNNNFTITERDHEHLKMSLSLSDLPNTTLSVFIMVYNHAEYLKECIDNILNQKTDFNYDIVVGEDCSKDNSREILLNYQKLYPGKFKLLLHNQNIGAMKNQYETFKNCTGTYIAICEGDDYWTDPLKLQKQVDFLEENKDFILCFHKVKILKPTGELVDDFITKVPENFELRETLAIKLNYIHTPSVLFRNVIQNEIDSIEFKNSPIGDYFLYMILTKYGKIGYLEDSMAVYRYGVGIFSSLNKIKHIRANILLFTNLYSYEKDPVIKEFFYKHLQYALSLIDEEFQKNDRIINSRRHKLVEKIYKFLKK